ncbi:hypothetical protein WDW86_00295 [Bdellovibrionota bacterium FG-2]
MRSLEFRKWEILLIFIGLTLLGGASFLYFSDVSLRALFLGMKDDESQERVGIVGEKAGKLRRQVTGEAEFKSIEPQSVLFNNDTVVTGPESRTKLVLDDQSTISLDSNTMIRLAFESRFSLTGISRDSIIQVISGRVSGESKTKKIILRSREKDIAIDKNQKEVIQVAPPSPMVPKVSPRPIPSPIPAPSPSAIPVQITLLTPSDGQILKIEPGSLKPEKNVELSFSVSPVQTPLEISLVRIEGSSKQELFREAIKTQAGKGAKLWIAHNPGIYEWEVDRAHDTGKGGNESAQGRFSIEPQFEGIQLQEPLVGGTVARSNRIQGNRLKSFDLTFRWNPYKEAKEYVIRVSNGENQILIEKKTKATRYEFNKNKILLGTVFYSIEAKLENGFIVQSPKKEFTFTFLPPMLTQPRDKAELANRALLTWQKTNFTGSYVLEISGDSEFKKIILHKEQKENFYVFTSPEIRHYWWRVQGIAQGVKSDFSKPLSFTIKKP